MAGDDVKRLIEEIERVNTTIERKTDRIFSKLEDHGERLLVLETKSASDEKTTARTWDRIVQVLTLILAVILLFVSRG